LRFIVVASYFVDVDAAFREASKQPLQACFGAFSALAFGFSALALLLGYLGRGGHKVAVSVIQAQPVIGMVAILALPDAYPRA
jgi:6-phosphofructokinase